GHGCNPRVPASCRIPQDRVADRGGGNGAEGASGASVAGGGGRGRRGGPPPPRCYQVAPQAPLASWAQAPLPARAGRVHASPRAAFNGVTGMESWFWWTGPTEVSWTQVGRPGITRDCRPIPAPRRAFAARLRQLRWTLGDGTQVTSGRAGSQARPSAQHVYETKSRDYVVEVERVWVGDPAGEFTDPGGRLPYPVMEIRSVLVETDTR
ncbi:MAG: hypothetical protein ACRDU8_07795, partial [Egibacteraceae bacterium]